MSDGTMTVKEYFDTLAHVHNASEEDLELAKTLKQAGMSTTEISAAVGVPLDEVSVWIEEIERWESEHERYQFDLKRAADGPVTKWCRGCQRNHPVKHFRWVPPTAEAVLRERQGPSSKDRLRIGRVPSLSLEYDEDVYVMYYTSRDNGRTVEERLGGSIQEAHATLRGCPVRRKRNVAK